MLGLWWTKTKFNSGEVNRDSIAKVLGKVPAGKEIHVRRVAMLDDGSISLEYKLAKGE